MGFFDLFKKKKNIEAKEEVKKMEYLPAYRIINDFRYEVVDGYHSAKYLSRGIFLDRFTLKVCLDHDVEALSSKDEDSFKKIYPDVLIMESEFPNYEYLDICLKVGPQTWMSFDGKILYNGMKNVFDYFNYNIKQWLKHEKEESDELKTIRVYALNIGSTLETENVKKNEYFLNNEKFLELKEKNFFGINEVHVKPFGPFLSEYKLSYYYDYIFRKDLFEPCFKHTFGKEELGFEMEELLQKFYITKIYYLDVDENGNVNKKVIENANEATKAYDIIMNELVPKLKENKIKLL